MVMTKEARMVKRNMSLFSQRLNYRLKIAFYLMSVLPLLVCIYLVSQYIVPNFGINKLDILVFLTVSIIMVISGFFIMKEIFRRIINISSEAKRIASGDLFREVEETCEDEIGDLGKVLNHLTNRIRSNMDELKGYGEKTTEINVDIQKQVMTLSILLQISSLISQGNKLEEIFKFVVEKLRFLTADDTAFLFVYDENKETLLMKVFNSADPEGLSDLKLGYYDEFITRLLKAKKVLILDKNHPVSANIKELVNTKLKVKNMLAALVLFKDRPLALLGIGNSKEDFSYSNISIELLDIMAKQVAIAFENDILVDQVGKLEVKDALTGLYNEKFIRSFLEEEIKRAITYHRPCAFILVSVDGFQEYRQKFGALETEAVLKNVASLIKDSIVDVDRLARFEEDRFAIALPESNKRRALEVAEEIRKKIEANFIKDKDTNKRITVSCGVSENPLDGDTAEMLISKVKTLLLNINEKKLRNMILK